MATDWLACTWPAGASKPQIQIDEAKQQQRDIDWNCWEE